MEKKETNLVIGIFNGYEESTLVTLDGLKSLCKFSSYTIEDYLDRRKSTNLTRFNFDPYTGEKIDWKKMREENN